MARLLFLQYSMVTGGAGMQIARLADALSDQGHQVDVVGLAGDGGSAAGRLGKARLLRCSLEELLDRASAEPYELVDAAWPLHPLHDAAVQGVMAACRWRPRLVVRCHSEACFLRRFDNARMRTILRAADRVVFHHDRQRADCIEAFGGALSGDGRCVIAPPGVDIGRFRPGGSDPRSVAEYARRFGLADPADPAGPRPVTLAMAGRPSAEKNWLDWAIVAARLRDEFGDQLRCLAVTGLQRGIRLRGTLDDLVKINAAHGSPLRITGLLDDWENLLASIDVYVQMSCSESFCRAAAEAQAAGVPCVVSDVGGLSAVAVRDGETGRCIPLAQGHAWKAGLTRRDRDAFHAALRYLILATDWPEWDERRRACRRHAEAHLDDRANTAWHVSEFGGLLSGPPSADKWE